MGHSLYLGLFSTLFRVICHGISQYNLISIDEAQLMGRLVIHHYYKEQNKEKRELEIINIILKMIRKKIS